MTNWKHTLDIEYLWKQSEGKGGTMPVSELGKKIAAIIKVKFAKKLDMSLSNGEYDPMLLDLVEYLESITGHDEATPVEEFDEVWAGFYDWADRNRVWIKTH